MPTCSRVLSPTATDCDYDEVPERPIVDQQQRPRAMTVTTTSGGDMKPVPLMRKVVENEYVPSPENSPRFDMQRKRSNTVSEFPPFNKPVMVSPKHVAKQVDPVIQENVVVSFRDDMQITLTGQKHLSGTSVESGLSFGYGIKI